MGAPVITRLAYIASIESIESAAASCAKVPAGSGILLGEYGRISPLAIAGHIGKAFTGPMFIEIVSKNKNRDLVHSGLVSSSICGFDGAVLASGLFDAGAGMAKPVYDLDPAQMLKLALKLKSEGTIPSSFIIIVRSAAGDGAAERRARHYLDEGADFIALDSAIMPALEQKSLLIEPIA
ncbi:MAG TPA: hypothetical protein VLM75_08025 [Spirochaetota bacterium]|nr:hypothetical protein [Spirochaetota bacterium]